MFEWKVEDMILRNQTYNIFLGREKIYSCESKTSREDKIAFVDSFHDGKLSYLLELLDRKIKITRAKDDIILKRPLKGLFIFYRSLRQTV